MSIIGFLAGSLTSIAFIPQAYKTIKTRDTSSISTFTFSILIIGVLLWIVYGVSQKDYAVIISNTISFFPNLIILLIKIGLIK